MMDLKTGGICTDYFISTDPLSQFSIVTNITRNHRFFHAVSSGFVPVIRQRISYGFIQ